MDSKDAAALKALAELGVNVAPKQTSAQIADLEKQLAQYELEIGSLDPELLSKFLVSKHD